MIESKQDAAVQEQNEFETQRKEIDEQVSKCHDDLEKNQGELRALMSTLDD